jgi:hypothetical protein
MHTRFYSENPKVKHHFGNIGTEGKEILNGMLIEVRRGLYNPVRECVASCRENGSVSSVSSKGREMHEELGSRDLRCSGVLRSLVRWLVNQVTGQHIGLVFKGRPVPEERRSHLHRCGSQKSHTVR